jgi:hypothetical protein
VLARDTSTERPSGTPSGVAGPSAIAWTEVSDPGGHVFGGPGDQVILGGVVTPDGLLAVGNTAARRSTTTGARDYDAAVWTRDATGTWQRAGDPAFAAPGNQEATDATVVDGRIVVVGSDSSSGDHDSAVWTIAAGATGWSRVDPDAPGMREPGDQWVRGVTWTGSHVVAVGANRLHGDDDAAIWISTDGLGWALAVQGELGQPGDQQMTTVTMLGDRIVAAGYSEVPGNRDAAVWISRDDGATWDPVEDDALGGEGDQQINAVIPAGPGLVAVGQEDRDGDRNAAVWTSTDGLRWERVDDPNDVLGGPGLQQMSGLAASDGVIVAAGSEVVDREIDGAVWTSRDGTTWTREDPTSPEMSTFTDYGRQGVRAILSTDAGFVAMGREGRGPNDDADVWIGAPSA